MRISSFLSFLFFSLFFSISPAQTNGLFTTSAGSDQSEFPGGVICDAQGNTYLTFTFSDTLNFKGQTFISRGLNDVLCAKLNPSGELNWARQHGGSFNDLAEAIAIDEVRGYVYVAGAFHDSTTLGPVTFNAWISGGNYDFFILKTDTAGNYLQHMNSMGNSDEFIYGMDVDVNGDVWVAGRYDNYMRINFVDLFTTGLENGFVAHFDTGATILAFWDFGGLNNDRAYDISVLSDSLIAVTGYFQDTIYLGDSSVSFYSAGGKDAIVVVFAKNGDFRWAHGAGGLGEDVGLTCEFDLSGNLYIGGQFDSSMTYRGTPLTGNGSGDGFMLKTDRLGNLIWSKAIGGTGYDVVRDLTLRPTGDLVFTGSFQDVAVFGPDTLNSGDPFNSDVYVANIDPAGTMIWGRSASGEGLEEGKNISTDQNGFISIMGNFSYEVSFGLETLVSTGNDDVFIVRMNPLGGVNREDEGQKLNPGFVKVYPNPSKGDFFISVPQGLGGEIQIDLLDISGKKLLSDKVSGDNGNSIAIRFPEYCGSGLYLVKMSTEKGVYSAKILLEK